MKLLHTSDWHLGRIIYGHSLLADQEYFIDSFLFPLIEKENPDAVILSGDIFDRQIAPVEAIRLFDRFVTMLSSNYAIPLIAISGNHDSADRLGLGTGLLRTSGVYITANPADYKTPVTLLDGALTLYSLPFVDPAAVRQLYRDDSIRGFNEAYKTLLDDIQNSLQQGTKNVLLAHCFVSGSEVSESESPLFVGNGGEIDLSAFSAFDYVALGHLHRPQRFGQVCYSGSPLKYSFDEASNQKSVAIVELDDTVTVRRVPVTPLHDLRVIKGSFNELTEQLSDDYLYAEVEDDPVFEGFSKLRKNYPRLLGMKYIKKTETEQLRERSSLKNRLAVRDDDTVFKEFLKYSASTEATNADMQLFYDAKAEVKED